MRNGTLCSERKQAFERETRDKKMSCISTQNIHLKESLVRPRSPSILRRILERQPALRPGLNALAAAREYHSGGISQKEARMGHENMLVLRQVQGCLNYPSLARLIIAQFLPTLCLGACRVQGAACSLRLDTHLAGERRACFIM